jgi:hypothetical protein
MFVTFPFLLFLVGAALLLALPLLASADAYFRNRGRHSVVCPENHQSVDVELDNRFAFFTAWRGQEHERLKACSRWPDKSGCDQDCLVQLNPSPENIDRLLRKWYEGKHCTRCN